MVRRNSGACSSRSRGADGSRQTRLSQVEAPGGAGEVASFGYCDEGLQLAKLYLRHSRRMAMSKIAFLGLGMMGAPIARNQQVA